MSLPCYEMAAKLADGESLDEARVFLEVTHPDTIREESPPHSCEACEKFIRERPDLFTEKPGRYQSRCSAGSWVRVRTLEQALWDVAHLRVDQLALTPLARQQAAEVLVGAVLWHLHDGVGWGGLPGAGKTIALMGFEAVSRTPSGFESGRHSWQLVLDP